MSEWERVALGDVTTQVKDGEKVVPGKTYDLLGLRMWGGGAYLRESVDTTTSKAKTLYRASKGQFIYNRMFAWGGSFGVVTAEFDGCYVSNEFPLMEPDPGRLHLGFLRLYFQQPGVWAQIDEASTGTTKSRNRWKESLFAAHTISLPPLAEQRRIVDVMAAVDAQIAASLVEARRCDGQLRLARLSLLTNGCSKGWASRKVSPDAVHLWTEKAALPAGWKSTRVKDEFTVRSGTTPSRKQQELYFDGGVIPWVKTMDLNEGIIEVTDESVTDAAMEQTSLRVYPADSVLVAMYGGFGQIGRTGRLGRPAATNQALSVLVNPSDDVLPAFAHEALKAGRAKFRQVAASSRKDPNITKADVENFDFPLPPLEEQVAIVSILGSLSAPLGAVLAEVEALRSLRTTLLETLLSQQVEIPESYDALLDDAVEVSA